MLLTLILNTLLSFSLQGMIDGKENGSAEAKAEIGQSMMKSVFDRFHINYEMSRTHKVGYYQESMSDNQSLYYLADGIVDIYVPCNLNQVENAMISPIKTRKKAFKEIDDGDFLLGNASDMARSSIWRPNSFFNEKNRSDYTYTHMYDSLLDENEVSVIGFEPVKSAGRASGKIYIDKESLAILMISYTPIVNHSKIWTSVSWTEKFEFRNGAYELRSVQFHGVGAENNYRYDAILVMDQLEVLSRIPANNSFIGDNVSLFMHAEEQSSESFWEGYEFLRQYLNQGQLLALN